MKTIMVTGGRGMLGHAVEQVVGEEPRAGYRFEFVDIEEGDLTDKAATRALFERVRPHGVIHLAADVGGLYKNVAQGVEMFENNLLMNMHVMQCCREFSVEKLVSCLSTCVFPEQTLCPHITLPIDETVVHMGPPHPSNEGYAYAKRMVDVQSRYYRRQYGCNFISLAPTNIFGPHDNYSPEHSHVIPALIRKCEEARVVNAPEVVCWGTGAATREFLYVDDAAEGIVRAAELMEEPVPINLGGGVEIPIRDLVVKIAAACDYAGRIAWDATKPDGQPRRGLDISRARQLLGWEPRQDFDAGLAKTVTWWREQAAAAG
jgi:GDP-L-fucose synthase